MNYKGYTIKKCYWSIGTFFNIYEGDTMVSVLALASIKAAKNVIDTYLKTKHNGSV